jgi:hypothetical protein
VQVIFNLQPNPDDSGSDSESDSDSEDEGEAAKRRAARSLRTQIMELPDSRHTLAGAVDERLRSLLDQVVEVTLPNINRQHDLLFVNRLERQLSGVDAGTAKPGWMSLVSCVRP